MKINMPPSTSNSNNKNKTVSSPSSSAPAGHVSNTTANFVPPQCSYLMEYVLDPCYTFLARYIPRAITPNQITVFGICCTCVASLIYFSLVMYPSTNDSTTGRPLGNAGFNNVLDFRFTTLENYGKFNEKFDVKAAEKYSSPALPDIAFSHEHLQPGSFVHVDDSIRWVLLFMGLLNVIYMIADNCDGKHARRYNMCSTVGEYLDHGLDSIAFSLSVFVLSSLLFERVAIAVLVQMFLCVLLYMTHSVNYSSGTMIWGSRFISVDEGTLLFSCGPLFVGLFPHAAEKLLFLGGLRVVQVVLFVLVLSQLETLGKYLKKDIRVLNLGLFSQILAFAFILVCCYHHDGGMAPFVSASLDGFHNLLHPFADWDPIRVGKLKGNTEQPSGAVIFLAAIVRCFGIFIRNILTCYPALVGLAVSMIASITAHIAVAAKTLYQPKEVWTPLIFMGFGTLLFAFNPPISVLFLAVYHAVQIRFNLNALISPQHLQNLAERKK